MTTPESLPSDDLRDRLLDALLPLVPFDGWTPQALEHAAESIDMDADERVLAAPNGVDDLIAAFFARADGAVRDRLMGLPEDARIRDSVTAGVAAWIDHLEADKLAVRAAVARSATHPGRSLSAAQRAWGLADLIWGEITPGPKDFSHYSKRTILSGVITSTVLAWLGADDRAAADRFLENRISNVMAFEAFKRRFRGAR